MQKNDLYDTIFQRKSIRKYDLTPLNNNRMKEISKYMANLEPMYGNINIELKILGPDNVKRRMMKKAPHYLAVFSQAKEGYLANVGFMLQQMDLFFSANGIGSCWQGIPKPNKKTLNSSNLEFIILIAFGKPDEPLNRNVSEFKRKSLKEISNVDGAEEFLAAARLAPFGSGQPWFFTGDENIIHAYSKKPNLIMGFLAKKYIPVDVGIALCHLKIAAEHFGKKTEIVLDKPAEKNPKDHTYVASLKLKKEIDDP